MEILWLGTIIILFLGAGILSARLWCYKKQIDHMQTELDMMGQEDTNYQFTSVCSVGKTEEIILGMNRLILHYREEVRQLKKENRIYRESITSISHDIRTPLTSAKGYLQMLRSGKTEEARKEEYLQMVEQRLDDLTDMLNQLFEYARIEAGEMELEPEVLNAGNLFADTISLFFDEFRQKSCEPEILMTQQPCHIKADQHAFLRIMENLIKNALVHGTGGYRFLLTQEKGQMLLSVSNLTDSIEPEDMDRIFDRFYTTDQSRSRKATGLGLAIVKRFTRLMGGTVQASLEEKRFTIEVRIPVI